jgi:hypothetical protein
LLAPPLLVKFGVLALLVSLLCLYITFCCDIHSVSGAPPVGGVLSVCPAPATQLQQHGSQQHQKSQ